MKRLFSTLIFAMLFAVAAMAQSEKTFVKSVNVETASVDLQLPGEVVANEWDKDYVRVTMSVHLLNSNDDILKRLAAVGRYELNTREENGTLIIEMPKMAQLVTIKGTDLQERLKFEVMYPKNVGVNVTQPAYYKTISSL